MVGKEKHLAIHVLASGSKGNCTVVEYGNTVLLHDVGISCRRIVNGLKELHIPMERVGGIFISHEHSDHIAGLPQLLKQFDIPVYTKEGTWREIENKKELQGKHLIPITKRSFQVGDIIVEPFKVSHDAADPIAASYFGASAKATIITDTGLVDDRMLKHIDDSQLLVLEANYDPHMLRYGPYALPLKQRVASNRGHMSNEMAAQVLTMMKRPDFMEVILAHRSENNNNTYLVTQTIGHKLVDDGIRIGREMKLSHGQPKERVSMYERRKES